MTEHPHIDPIRPTRETAAALITRIDAMMPGVLAEDERTRRLNEASARRRMGLELHPDEVKADLRDALDGLLRHVYEHQARVNRYLQTPAQMLAYAERAALYIGRDYPRELSGDTDVTGLWDAWDMIHTAAYEWRKGAYPHKAVNAVIVFIQRTAENARAGRYVTFADEAPDEGEGDDQQGE